MERILQRWYDMISIRSVNGHEAQMADYVANVLRELGMDPHYSYFEEDTACERPSVWSVLDSGTGLAPMVSWSTTGSYTATTLGVSNLAFAPFAPMLWLSIMFSVIYAVTGIGTAKAKED